MSEETLIEFSVTPLGAGASVSPYVARCAKVVRASGLPSELHAMGTLVEASLDQCFDLVKACVRAQLTDCPRVSVALKMDVRPGHTGRLRGKVESVERHLRDRD